MSNTLNSLLGRVAKVDAALAHELRDQVEILSKRREFGLNFEKHMPESVELHGRVIRVGDKVRFLSPRGSTEPVRRDTWVVQAIRSKKKASASLVLDEGHETAERLIEDLVVVADFRDPIYPGLRSTGAVARGLEKPFHAVINAENYHALEALLFVCQGRVDVIYIDPPYNTRDKDWKYNNDYVDGDDDYKHSKWLSFMERRLKLAKKLLNPLDSVLIVTIDEKEYLRLGLLLGQIFPAAEIQMVSSVINQAGSSRPGSFARTDEYLYFVKLGTAAPRPLPLGQEWMTGRGNRRRMSLYWNELMRTGPGSSRAESPNLFFPVYLDKSATHFVAVGEPLPLAQAREGATHPRGVTVRWPIRRDGSEGRWRVSPNVLRSLIDDGFARLGRARGEETTIQYLSRGEITKVRTGVFEVVGRRTDGSVEVSAEGYEPEFLPGTQWNIASHDASQNGSALLAALLPGRKFPFPKSLYAVEDTIRFFVKDKPNALVLDYFGGSGTTTHAVARLNRLDGGTRRSIVITNNEVSNDEANAMRKDGFRPGDPEWEALGISSYITKPRISAALTGLTPEGTPIAGDYKFTEEFPFESGLDENVEFFDLTYEDPRVIDLDMAFEAISPLLWMRAGAEGRRITTAGSEGFEVADTYAVLFRVDASAAFLQRVAQANEVRVVFIVTDDEKQFQMIAVGLPPATAAVRLYESYLRTFEINTGKE